MTGPIHALRKVALLALLALGASACGSSSSAPPVVDAARSTLAAAPAQQVADGAAAVTLTAVARDAGGNPIAGRVAAFTVTGAGNVLSAAQATTGADGAASVTVRSTRAEAKTARVTIDGVAVTQAAALAFVAGPPSAATSTLVVTGAPAVADGVAAATVTVTVLDANGNPVGGAAVDLAVTGGAPSAAQVTTGADGVAAAGVTSTVAGTATVAASIGGAALAGPADVTFVAGPAASLVLGAQPSAGIAGGVIAAIVVAAQDANGNAASLPGDAAVTILSGPAGAVLLGTASQPAGATATFADLVLQRAGTYVLRVSSGALQADTAAFAVAPAAPSVETSTLAAAAATAAAGEVVGLTATVRDAFGNPVPGVTVVLTATGTANTLVQPAAPTDAAGQAAGSISSTRAEDKSISASTGGGASVAFLAGPPAAATSTLALSAATATADGASSVTATATVRDAFGNPVAGVAVDFTALGAVLAAPQATTAADGRASVSLGSSVAGLASVSASVGGIALGPQAVTFVAGPAASLALVAQPGAGVAGAPLSPLTVTARDATGNATALPGAATVALLASPAGAVLSGTATQPAGPSASFADLSVQRSGAYRLRVTSGALSVDGDAFTVAPAAAAALAFTASPAGPVTAGAPFGATVELRDAFGNLSTSTAAVTLSAGASTLGGATTVAGAAGVATFAGLAIEQAAAGVELTATSPGLGTATADRFDVVAGPAASLLLAAQPSAGVAGATLAALTVAARDAFGNATALPGAATVTLLASPAGAVLSGTTSQPAGSGASFADLSVQRSGAYRLRVTSGALAVDGDAFTVAPAAAAALAFVASPAGPVAAGAPFGATVELRDAFGNVADSGAVVTLSLGAPGTLSGAASAAAVAGVATFSGLSVDRAGPNALQAGAAGVAGASVALEVVPGAAAALAFTVQPGGASAGELLSPPVEVSLRDAFGNAVADDGVAVSVQLVGGRAGATLLGATSALTVGGRATFADLAVDLAAGGYALRAAAAGLAGADSATFSITSAAVDPATSTVAVSAATATAGGAVALTATARDFFGNPVAGATVTFAATGTANTLTQPGAATDAAGQAGGSLSSTRAEAKTVSASAGGAPFTTTAGVTFQPDAPATANSSLVASPASATADGVAVVGLIVNVLDQYDNPVPGVTVSVSAGGSGNLLTPASPISGADGRALATLRSTVAESKTVSASAGATALGGPLQVAFTPGPAASLVLTAQPSAGTAGVALATLTVAARDAFSNATALPGPATVSLVTAPSGAALGGTTTVSGGASAAFADLLLVRAGAYRLRVTSGGLTVDGADFTVAPAAPAALAFTASPAAPVAAGATFAAAVEVRDAFDNLTGSTAVVGLALAAPGTLSGTTSRAAVAGLASFPGLSVDRAGDNALVATSPGLTPASASITVVPGPAAALAFVVQPADVAAGDLFTPPVEVALRDAFGNATADDGVAVAVELLGGTDGAALFGSPLGVTLGGAVAFADLAVDLAGAGYRLRATASGLTEALSAAFAVTSGPADPAVSDVAAAPTSAVAGETVSLTATVRDFFGNPVAGATVTFSATGTANTIVQPAASTDDLGRASGELTSTRAEEKTVSGEVGGATLGGTATVTYLPDVPSAATSSLSASPTSVLADGTAIALTATILDQYSNPIPGLTAVFAADGPATFTPASAATDAAGVATGAVSSLTPGPRRLSVLVGGAAVAGADVVFESTDRDNDGIPNGEDLFPDDPTRFDAFSTVLLDPLAVGAFGTAVAINDADQVAGYGDDGAGAARALAWTTSGVAASAAIELQPIPGNASSAAYGIGPTGTVVGESEKGADTVAVVWLAGSPVPAELSLAGVTPPAAALGVGGSFIAGEATVGGQRRGVLWVTAGADPAVLATLGGPASAAYAVSATGLVVGEAETGAGQVRGALWVVTGGVPGAAVALAPLPGHVRSSALAVSATGVIAGESEAADGTVHGVRWVLDAGGSPGPAADLGVGSAAAANATRVAGALGIPGRAVTWDLRNLALSEDLAAGAAEPGRALGMNAANKVVGLAGGQGFVAVP